MPIRASDAATQNPLGRQGSCANYATFSVGEEQERTDIRAFWTAESGHYQVGAFVKNGFDNRYVSGINNITVGTQGTAFVGLTDPQIWGVDFKYVY